MIRPTKVTMTKTKTKTKTMTKTMTKTIPDTCDIETLITILTIESLNS